MIESEKNFKKKLYLCTLIEKEYKNIKHKSYIRLWLRNQVSLKEHATSRR